MDPSFACWPDFRVSPPLFGSTPPGLCIEPVCLSIEPGLRIEPGLYIKHACWLASLACCAYFRCWPYLAGPHLSLSPQRSTAPLRTAASQRAGLLNRTETRNCLRVGSTRLNSPCVSAQLTLACLRCPLTVSSSPKARLDPVCACWIRLLPPYLCAGSHLSPAPYLAGPQLSLNAARHCHSVRRHFDIPQLFDSTLLCAGSHLPPARADTPHLPTLLRICRLSPHPLPRFFPSVVPAPHAAPPVG
jgi:hypothetical protein